MGRRNWGFKVDEAEIGVVENVGDVGEKRAPALAVGWVARGSSSGGRGAHRLMRNHVATDSKADLGKFVRIRNNDGGSAVPVGASDKCRA